MFDKSTGHGNDDVMMAQYVFLFPSRAIFRETLMEMDIHTVNVIVKKKNKSTTIFMVCSL